MKLSKLIIAAIILGHTHFVAAKTTQHDPAEVAIGERLFLETRFAQAYHANPNKADPALDYTLTMRDPIRSPFAGQTMNCRACHLVDDHHSTPQAGMRTYADFAHHSPIPHRNDGKHVTPRNSMSLVNINPANNATVLLHFDGEFNTMEDLVRATLSGRNYGWLPDETIQAVAHVARIIREDDGSDELGKELGGSYTKLLTGTAKDIARHYRLPADYRVDVASASDEQIFNAVAKLISAYVNDLNFAQDDEGHYIGSPYDQFLKLNQLPRKPRQGESPQTYSQRLLSAVNKLAKPQFVSQKHGKFVFHQQAYEFKQLELQGMKLFFSQGTEQQRGGNCVACHAAPHFSDYAFHNSGLTQINYDDVHGQGEFMRLEIPDLSTRNRQYDVYLPKTAKHPKASARFLNQVDMDKPGWIDLGLWNVFANPDMPAPQAKLKSIMCQYVSPLENAKCNNENVLPLTIAAFKTPVLRDLGHSDPYMHSGQFATLAEAVKFYITSSALAQQGKLRNADARLKHITITQQDVAALVAFINALNEDYE